MVFTLMPPLTHVGITVGVFKKKKKKATELGVELTLTTPLMACLVGWNLKYFPTLFHGFKNSMFG